MLSAIVFGAHGQLGHALQAFLGPNILAFAHADVDITDETAVRDILRAHPARAVYNAAAYTQVDRAETPEERERVFAINAHAPGLLAKACADARIPFVHFSTDYVFDGSGTTPWRESDTPSPLNIYGESKLAGELAVQEAGGDHLIFRTSWVYAAHGKNFFRTMAQLMQTRDMLNVVADQIGAPTYAPHLAYGAIKALTQAQGQQHFPSGVYHLSGAGETSWHGFATAIADALRKNGAPLAVKDIAPIPSSAYPTPAARPHNSRLDCSLASRMLGVTMPSWQDGLSECIREYLHVETR